MRILILLSLSISLILATNKQRDKQDLTLDIFKANINFALNIYKQISSKTAKAPPNLCFSPISIYATLSMLALGAKSKTRQNILEGMGLDATKQDKELQGALKSFFDKLNQQTDQVKLMFGNEIFVAESANILPKYLQDLTYYYNASIQNVNFNNPRNAEEMINTLTSVKTANTIEHAVSNLHSNTMMVLTDFLIFQGSWKSPFKPQNTEEKSFNVNEDNSVLVPMMRQVAQYKTYKDRKTGCIVVEVPYTDNTVLLLIVPKLGDLYKVERSLTPEMIKRYLHSTKTSLLDFSMPRLSMSNPVNVKYALLAMEMATMFSGDNADFSGISNKPKLKVSEFYHQSSTNFTEGNTQSRGATVSQAIYASSNPEFKVTRPFLLLVYRKDIDTILLMGRVMNPSQN
ncbi:serine protease inhibitor A6-like [Gastrophryne carolinensis]